MGGKSRAKCQKADGTAYSAMDLREIQDWIIRPQLQRVQGVAEVNSIGGYNKTYVVSPDLTRLQQLQIPLTDLQDALQNNNENVVARFIEENASNSPFVFPALYDVYKISKMLRSPLKTVYLYGLRCSVSIDWSWFAYRWCLAYNGRNCFRYRHDDDGWKQ